MKIENYSKAELEERGIKFGKNVLIHRSVQFFGNNFTLGSDVRIDCFCLLSSSEPVTIGSNVHIGAGVYIFGAAGVIIEDYCGISSRCSLFTTSDDYSGGHLTNPTIPDKYKFVTRAPVRLVRHAIIGCGSVIMPGVTIGRGASVGALSFVNKSVPEFAIVGGMPIRRVGTRDREKLESLELLYENEIRNCKKD